VSFLYTSDENVCLAQVVEPTGATVCIASSTVTGSRRTQQATSRVVLSTCCIMTMLHIEACSPALLGQPVLKAK